MADEVYHVNERSRADTIRELVEPRAVQASALLRKKLSNFSATSQILCILQIDFGFRNSDDEWDF